MREESGETRQCSTGSWGGRREGAYLVALKCALEPKGPAEATDHHPPWPQGTRLGDYFL